MPGRQSDGASSSGLAGMGSLRVAVVGGGISGLSTAWYVEQQAKAHGLRVTCSVYEAADRWGGRIRTDVVEREEGRFVIEGGPDSFLTLQKPWAVDMALQLGLAGRLLGTNDAARKVFVLSKGKPVPLPDGVFLLLPTKFKPFILSPLISPLGKLRMGLELFIPPRRGTADETLQDFVTRRLGNEALDKIAEPLLSGIYNAEATRQSLLATFPRFRETEQRYGSLIRGMLAGRAQTRTATAPPLDDRPRSAFVSFLDGTEEIVEGLKHGLQATLRTGARVKSIRPQPGGSYLLDITPIHGAPSDPEAPSRRDAQIGATQTMQADATETIQADAVILAVPAYDAADLVAPFCPPAAEGLRTIRYVSTGTLSLAYREDPSSDRLGGFGVLVPRSERRPLNAVTWSSTKFGHRAPGGYSLLRVFFGGSRSPQSMQLDDDELFSTVKRQLRDIMGIAQEPLFRRIYRWEKANPQYDVEHLSRVNVLERALPPGIWVTGSAYRGVGLPDCVHQAQMTAENVVETLKSRQRSAA